AVGIGRGGEGKGPGRGRAGVADSGAGDETGVAGTGRENDRLVLIRGTVTDAGEVDRLRPGVLVQGQIWDRVQRWRIVYRVDQDEEGSADQVIGAAIVVDCDRDAGRAKKIRCRRKTKSACSVRTA